MKLSLIIVHKYVGKYMCSICACMLEICKICIPIKPSVAFSQRKHLHSKKT